MISLTHNGKSCCSKVEYTPQQARSLFADAQTGDPITKCACGADLEQLLDAGELVLTNPHGGHTVPVLRRKVRQVGAVRAAARREVDRLLAGRNAGARQ